MSTELKAAVYKYERRHKASLDAPADGQVICWSDCPNEPNTWRVSEIQYEGDLPYAYNYANMDVPLPSMFYWFQIPQFVALYKLAEDAGL
jgi:hypothetical protein